MNNKLLNLSEGIFRNLLGKSKWISTWSSASLCALSIILSSPDVMTAGEAGSAADGPFVVLIGAPGSGKTTFGTVLSEKFEVPLIKMAEVLEGEIEKAAKVKYRGSPTRRRASASRAASSRAALEQLKAGELADDETLNAVAAARISGVDAVGGFIIDGYPSTIQQAEFLDAYLDARGVDDLMVIFLDVPDSVALERMKDRGRVDDKYGLGEERLKQFNATIQPILWFYEGDRFFTVNTDKEMAEVKEEITEIVSSQL